MRIVIFSLLLFYPVSPLKADSAWNWNSRRMSASVDITGDGKPERIRLEQFVTKDRSGEFARNNYYRLSINDQSIYGDENTRGFILTEINQRDRWKEIAVISPYAIGDWDGCYLYWFDGINIHRVTRKPLMAPHFYGNGRVTTRELVGNLSAEVTYRLQPNHTLQRVRQKYYSVQANAVVKQPFPIYSRPAFRKIAMLPKGTRVRILKSDLGNWLYLRAGKSTYGWMNTQWNNQYAAFGWVAAG